MHITRYNRWVSQQMEDPDLTAELSAIKDDAEAIRERFAIDLSFGTAGMRGVIGAGTNRMNIYTVRLATQGLANFLKNSNTPHPSVAIGYDSRIKSDLFANNAAAVLAANGVAVHLYPVLQPVPLASFAVRHLGCSAGIMVTASHNPAKYNGYKVYGPDGCQMNTDDADAVLDEIAKLDIFDDVKCASFDEAVADGRICTIGNEVVEAYYKNVLEQTIRPGTLNNCDLSVVYSPLNGAGNVPVRHILAQCGLKNVQVVKEQELPNGNFPTCPYPNPEIRETLQLGLKMAHETSADLMLATDPDADRIGIAVRDQKGEYQLMSGNEVGVLLLNYIYNGRKDTGTLPANPLLIKSIVSTPMADQLARHFGMECDNVLTGFKYIGERIAQLEANHQQQRFILGFEESYGYLAGTYVRDKDAVVAAMLICEMAAYYKGLGQSLHEAMEGLYKEFGRYLNVVESFEFEGLSGMEKMDNIMASLRSTPPTDIGGLKVEAIADYETGSTTTIATGQVTKLDLPASNVLAYSLVGGSLVTVRPSGTEPKVKVYYAIREKDIAAAEKLHAILATAVKPLLA